MSFPVINSPVKKASCWLNLSSSKLFMRNPQFDDMIALSSMPVKVIYADGQQIEKGFTNSEGKFSVNVMATPLQGDKGKILIKNG
jgi:hypothetical protein